MRYCSVICEHNVSRFLWEQWHWISLLHSLQTNKFGRFSWINFSEVQCRKTARLVAGNQFEVFTSLPILITPYVQNPWHVDLIVFFSSWVVSFKGNITHTIQHKWWYGCPGYGWNPGIQLGNASANERRCYNVTSSLIGWVHTQNGPWNRLLLKRSTT